MMFLQKTTSIPTEYNTKITDIENTTKNAL